MLFLKVFANSGRDSVRRTNQLGASNVQGPLRAPRGQATLARPNTSATGATRANAGERTTASQISRGTIRAPRGRSVQGLMRRDAERARRGSRN